VIASLHETLEPGQICPCCGYPTAQNIDDMISGVDRARSETEGSSEVVPHTRVADSINLRSPDFARLVRGGVTTVFVSPDSSAVIGPKGAVVRTAGPLADRVVEPEAAVKATFGSDAYRVGAGNAPPFPGFVTTRTRRPNTRMGVAWVFRKAFYDAERFGKGETPGGADSPPEEALPVLADIRAGKIGLRAQARTQPDILTALRLCKELGLKFTLLEGTEAYKCLEELKSTGTPVVYGPIYDTPSGLRSFTNEAEYSRLSTLRELIEAGIPTALSAQDLREEDGLARQAMYAVRAGVTPEKALEAITLTPARLLGIDKDVGTLEGGKRADLVVWSGEPLEATSRPLLVVIGGRTVYDGRDKDGAK
jgi:imidazolonepropionase-like amidohydrolase